MQIDEIISICRALNARMWTIADGVSRRRHCQPLKRGFIKVFIGESVTLFA